MAMFFVKVYRPALYCLSERSLLKDIPNNMIEICGSYYRIHCIIFIVLKYVEKL